MWTPLIRLPLCRCCAALLSPVLCAARVCRCPLCFEPVYPQALKSVRFRLHSKVAVGSLVSLVLVQREKQSPALTAARVEAGVREAAARAMREGSKATLSTSSFTADVQWALDVDPALDPTLFTRVTWTGDISGICRRELDELSAAVAFHLSSAGQDDVAYQFLLHAQQEVVRRLEHWSATHPHSSQLIRALVAQAHATQRRVEDTAKERRAAAASRVVEQRRAAVQPVKPPVPSKPKAPAVNFDDASAWPTLSGSRGAAGPSSAPRPIRSLQPKPAASEDGSGSSSNHQWQPPSSETTTAAAAAPPPAAYATAPTNASRLGSAFFDAGEEEEARDAGDAGSGEGAGAVAPPPLSAAAAFSSFDPSRCFYFYQSLDGQPLFLHSLCFRALLQDAGQELGRLPACITARVEGVEDGFMDRGTAERYRFLSHLPSAAPFRLLLLALPNLVRPQTAAAFASEWTAELRQRQRRLALHQAEQRRRQRRQQTQSHRPHTRAPAFQLPPSSSSFTSASSSASSSSFAASAYDSVAWLDESDGEVSEDAVAALVDSFPALLAPHSPQSPPMAASSPSLSSSAAPAGSAPLSSAPLPLSAWTAIAAHGMAASSSWAALPSAAPSAGASVASPASKAQPAPTSSSPSSHRLRFRPLL